MDLFNQGVDLPAIDTVLMPRPTEPKVLLLQQLGRGLRCHPDKAHLVVLDFIGNHQGFLNKPQALFEVGTRQSQLATFGRRVRDAELALPPGCFADYDLAIIDSLVRLQGKGPAADYQALRDSRSKMSMGTSGSAIGRATRSTPGPAPTATKTPSAGSGWPRATAA